MSIPPARPSTISRRTLVTGTAWAVPAVIVGTAAPAVAASGCAITASLTRLSCVDRANNTFYLVVSFTSSACSGPTNLVLQSISSPFNVQDIGIYYAVPKDGEQSQQVAFTYTVGPPTTLTLNTVIQYPTGQVRQSFPVTPPTNACAA